MKNQSELFDRSALKLESVGGPEGLRKLHGDKACIDRCLCAAPGSPCECPCNGVCHSGGLCLLKDVGVRP